MDYRARQIEHIERAILRALQKGPVKAIEIKGLLGFSPPPGCFSMAVDNLVARFLVIREGVGKRTIYRLASHEYEP